MSLIKGQCKLFPSFNQSKLSLVYNRCPVADTSTPNVFLKNWKAHTWHIRRTASFSFSVLVHWQAEFTSHIARILSPCTEKKATPRPSPDPTSKPTTSATSPGSHSERHSSVSLWQPNWFAKGKSILLESQIILHDNYFVQALLNPLLMYHMLLIIYENLWYVSHILWWVHYHIPCFITVKIT